MVKVEQIKRQVGWFHFGVLVIGIGCLIYWGNGNDMVVEVPVVNSAIVEQLKEEKQSLQRRVQELTAENKAKDVKIKSIKFVMAQYEQQLKDLRNSVPAQTVVYEAIRKEASTDKGFRQAVARSFGGEIAGRIEVR